MTGLVGRTGSGHPTLRVHVQPRSARNRCCGVHDDRLKLMVTAPPVDGKANKAVRVYLAKLLGVKPAGIALQAGETSRRKTFYFKTLGERELSERLRTLLAEQCRD